MECPGLNIHKYYESEDVTRCHPLNPELIEFISEQGWVILDKLAEGSVADVFTCKQNHIIAVLIIFGNVDLENTRAFDIFDKLEQARKLPNIFPIIYDIINSDIPYSTDEVYLENSEEFQYRTIQVIEKVDMTLETYLETIPKKDLRKFAETLRKTLIQYLTVLEERSIYYTDLKLENIGVILSDTVYLKLLDIEGIHLSWDGEYDVKKMVDNFIRYNIKM